MTEVYNYLATLIKTTVPKFKAKNTLFINKKILAKDLTANETIYINGQELYSDSLVLTGSVLSDHQIQIIYIHKTDINTFDQPQAIQELLSDMLWDNLHSQPYWYNLDFSIENTIDDAEIEEYEGGWNGFIINLTITKCEVI